MVNDVFHQERGSRSETGRCLEIGIREVVVRLRSEWLHAGCHWIGQHVLCGGSECPVCQRGVPKRPFSFAQFERQDGTFAILRATPRDVESLEGTAREAGEADYTGAVWALSRPKSRQPLAIRFLRRTPAPFVISRDVLAVEVLRMHSVQVTLNDIQAGTWVALVSGRRILPRRGKESSNAAARTGFQPASSDA